MPEIGLSTVWAPAVPRCWTAPGRLGTALVRVDRGGEPAPMAIDEAIAATARRLRQILDEHGPDALALYVSGQMTLEAQYLANKLAKGFWRTNQIESNSRLCMASAGSGYLGTDLALLNGLLHLLIEHGHLGEEFIAEFTEGWDTMPGFLTDYPPAKVAHITGIPEADIQTAARWIGAAGHWMSCWTMGLNQSTHGTWNTNALCNLHLATGAICRSGSGPFSLTGQPNAMGGHEMGYLGPGLPGQRSVLVAAGRRFVEDLWDLPPDTLRTDVGTGTIDMFARMAAGEIKACWITCTNPVATVANRATVIDALEAAEFVVTQDVFADTETNAYADMVLPAAMWAETEGRPGGPRNGLRRSVLLHLGGGSLRRNQAGRDPPTGYDLRGVTYHGLRTAPAQWSAAPGDEAGRNPVRYLNNEISQQRRTRPDGTTPTLSGNQRLSLPGSAKEVRQFSLDTTDRDLIYHVGDALSVRPVNHPELVAEWLAITGLNPDEAVKISSIGELPLGETLHRHLDITKITPDLLGFIVERTHNRDLKTLLRPGNAVELSKWTWGRQAADVVAEFPVHAPARHPTPRRVLHLPRRHPRRASGTGDRAVRTDRSASHPSCAACSRVTIRFGSIHTSTIPPRSPSNPRVRLIDSFAAGSLSATRRCSSKASTTTSRRCVRWSPDYSAFA